MKKKNLFLGVLLASAAFGLAACQGNGNSTTSGTTPTTTQGVTPTTTSGDSDPTTPTTPTGDPSTPEDTSYVKMGNKEYATIAAALADVPTSNDTGTYVITLGKGTYNENALAYNGTATIHIKGDTTTKYGEDVIIKGHGSNMGKERERELLEIQGTGNIILENVSLQSDWTRTLAGGNNAQAEVLGTDTKGNTVAYNCSFKSNQDTIRTAGKAWFYGCYIEGDVDFLWMETAGQVALYEKCEIVSVYDSTATSHASYFTAPRMGKSVKVGKGLVIYNSVCKESAEAKEKGQQTYLARNPWSSETTYYNQVAYINTTVSDVETDIWKGTPTATDYDMTSVGWKMDKATAASLNYTGNNDIISDEEVAKEFNGREAILNRVYNTGKLKYTKDEVNYWDLASLITANNWTVDADSSKSTLDGEVAGTVTTYKFDGSTDLSAYVSGFAQDNAKPHYVGKANSTITIPVNGKCYVEIYGYYAGTIETTADSQSGKHVMFFNNSTTNTEIENDFIVYDANAKSVTITAKDTTYITKIVVQEDTTIENTPVSAIEVTGNTKTYCVGIPLKLSAKAGPGTAVNKSVLWSSSDETIAKIDEYTGKVVFLKEGEVKLIATACDGSGVTGSITCKPTNPKWTVAEWYTTDSSTPDETGATEIGAFDPTKDSKALDKEYTFTNIAGKEIKTSKGLKQNSAGILTVYTTKAGATLTVITVSSVNQKAVPAVSDGTNSLTPTSTVENADGTITYTYALTTAGAWAITRGDTSKECNPILYAKCEYDTLIKSNAELTFGTNGNYESPSLFNITAEVINNGGTNAQLKNGNIEFTVAAGAQVEVYANWGEAYTITLADGTVEAHDGTNVGNDGKRLYTYDKETKVTIACDPDGTGHNYFYWVKVTFPTA